MSTSSYKKLVVTQFGNDIRKAGAVVETPLRPPAAGEILVKNMYAGVNATDMNILTGRSKLAIGDGGLPLDLGLEVSVFYFVCKHFLNIKSYRVWASLKHSAKASKSLLSVNKDWYWQRRRKRTQSTL